jgi:hypothetical protein
MKHNVIIMDKTKGYRILEVLDTDFDIENLKGDCFNPFVNNDRSIAQLRIEEVQFENKVRDEGVYGYILERWSPQFDTGWEHVDSCFGFVGNYETEKHYIVDEYIQQMMGE